MIERFEDTRFDPLAKPPMHRALAAILAGQVLPFRPIVQNPEDTFDDLAFFGWRTASLGTSLGGRYFLTKPIQLFRT